MQPADIVLLARRLADAQAAERRAKEMRIQIEAEIIAAVDFREPEGQKTYNFDATGVGSCSLTLKQPITATVDSDAWDRIRRGIDRKHPAHKIFRTEWKIDTKEARALQAENPEAFAIAAEAITRKPGKIAVELKQLVGNP